MDGLGEPIRNLTCGVCRSWVANLASWCVGSSVRTFTDPAAISYRDSLLEALGRQARDTCYFFACPKTDAFDTSPG